jgi:octaprenyl-diphosphate synthase
MFAAGTKAGVAPDRSSQAQYVTWKHIVEPVEPFMDRVAHALAEQVDAFDSGIVPYARYALTNQGKQLRPALVALSGNAAGCMNDQHVTVAVIIEMVHLATLVHDDIMANWGNQISVLVGDCLFAHALKLAASFPSPEICRAVASATNTVCSGEILQTQQRRNFKLTRAEYFKILEMKTAELFALSCDLGSSLGEAGEPVRTALRNFGLAFGTAYQIYDDCLDLFGSEAAVGKSLGTDLASGKLTLPILIIFERGSSADQAQLRECVQHWEPSYYPQVLKLLETYNAQAESRDMIHYYLAESRRALSPVPDSEGKAALLALGDFLAQQTDALGVTAYK